MKKLFSIFFLTVFLTSVTELHQLFKITFLIEHYIEHKGQDDDMSLLQFFLAHYTNGYMVDADHEKDVKLPFKSCCHQTNSIDLITTVKFSKLSFVFTDTFLEENTFHTKNSSVKISSFLASIWQPPKFC